MTTKNLRLRELQALLATMEAQPDYVAVAAISEFYANADRHVRVAIRDQINRVDSGERLKGGKDDA